MLPSPTPNLNNNPDANPKQNNKLELTKQRRLRLVRIELVSDVKMRTANYAYLTILRHPSPADFRAYRWYNMQDAV